jgi:hypothetical protein
MKCFSALLASIAVLLPAATAGGANAKTGILNLAPDGSEVAAPMGFDVASENPWRELLDAPHPKSQEQVRIEQRIIMRISPRPQASRQDLLAELPRSEPTAHIEERKIGSCVPIQGIASVGTGQDDRLILFMRDRRIVSAALEKTCSARDFYSGFYIQRSEDGRICVKRDKIQSRAGAKCEISQLRQLVAVKD